MRDIDERRMRTVMEEAIKCASTGTGVGLLASLLGKKIL